MEDAQIRNLLKNPDQYKSTELDRTSLITERVFPMNLENSHTQEQSPSGWRKQMLQPPLKKGKQNALGNYRPFSLTVVLEKILELVPSEPISGHMKENNMLWNSQ